MLQKTLAYHQWAERTLPLLGNEKAINEHPVYGRMRQIRLKDDFLFSERELDKIFGQLVMHNQRNGLALQYLSSLAGDGTYVFTYDNIPVALNLLIYLLGAFICGFCVCMLNTVTNPMLNLLGGGGNKGNQLNLIGGTLNSLSGSLTPMLVGAIVGESLKGKEIDDVNIVLYIAMAVFALIYIVIRFTPLAEPQAVTDKVVYERSPWAFRHLTLGVIAIFIYVGVEVGVPASLITYLHKNYGAGYDDATFIAGLYWLLMLVGRSIGSIIGGKVSSRAMVLTVSCIAILGAT
jgi:FHS family L-fucose permease-like MFS transporter